nr:MAG TPA: hypothetical protein [Caudoviricetes sp.]
MGLKYIKSIPNSIESLKEGRVTTITHSNIGAITAFIKPKKPFEIGQILVRDVDELNGVNYISYILLTPEGKQLYVFRSNT